MFQFTACPSHDLWIQSWITGHYTCWVAPFGNPRITAYLTATRGLSQPIASFFGSNRQGIHHMHLPNLIFLDVYKIQPYPFRRSDRIGSTLDQQFVLIKWLVITLKALALRRQERIAVYLIVKLHHFGGVVSGRIAQTVSELFQSSIEFPLLRSRALIWWGNKNSP